MTRFVLKVYEAVKKWREDLDMPAYAVPTDALDLALLDQHAHVKGIWVVIYTILPGTHYVFGSFKSWRIARRFAASTLAPGRVYWCDGLQFWLAT